MAVVTLNVKKATDRQTGANSLMVSADDRICNSFLIPTHFISVRDLLLVLSNYPRKDHQSERPLLFFYQKTASYRGGWSYLIDGCSRHTVLYHLLVSNSNARKALLVGCPRTGQTECL